MVGVGGELIRTRWASGNGTAARPHLMEWRLDPTPIPGRQRRSRRGQPQIPPPEVPEQCPLVGGQDRELHIGVGARLVAQEQVQRPPARHPPCTGETGHDPQHPAGRLLEGRRAVGGEPAGFLVWVEAAVRPGPVRRGLEDRVQVHGAVDVWERLVVGVGPLEADLRREGVGVDQQQHQVGPAGEQLVGDRGVLGRRGTVDEAVLAQARRGVDPGTAGPLPVLLGGDVEDDTHGCSNGTDRLAGSKPAPQAQPADAATTTDLVPPEVPCDP
jgi:hypothetical protein